ncbi:hypothetical protein N7478_012529 [Penicillium angulare]|uniref:uncharacterized protein n=1 Tax=Penicillium angulare TaxID=116970 RepID=UPI0025420517|nr:uncharacterized protein N7478_012529 [Penicillium angulare]KAJ5259548.1 hypothetical protein N7478_012529 [Penicillium angulare]
MLCHRNANKPNNELISRFQKLCGSSFFYRVTDNKQFGSFIEGKNVNTPSEGFNSIGSVNPSQLWKSMDPFGPVGVYSPRQITYQGSDYENLGLSAEPLYKNEMTGDQSPPAAKEPVSQDSSIADAENLFYSESEQFRYHTILRASTAMVSDPREVPVSYLNKGHVYHLIVVDSKPSAATSEITKYRTFVRISFKQEQQRSNPAAYWKLCKACRGMEDSQKNDNQFRAVEYVGHDIPHMSIENVGLDGFSITWTIDPNRKVPGCSIPVRFNFLSTDFTLSKGVKGASVRLCAKTKQLNEIAAQESEACFCNVKLFRDHGAERKLSNDVASIRKRIQRLKQQMSEPAPPKPASKRKRGSIANSKAHLSCSKKSLQGGGMPVGFEDSSRQTNFRNHLQSSIDGLQSSIYTSRRESVLSFRAEVQDDPEMYLSSPMESYDVQPSIFAGAHQITTAYLQDQTPRSSTDWTPNTMSSFQSGASTGSFKSERATVPAACFYVRFLNNDQSPKEYYRAIYPKTRTVDEMVSKISEKSFARPADVARILHVNKSGLKIVVDDGFVQKMPEGQRMVVRILAIPLPSADSTETDNQVEIRLEY